MRPTKFTLPALLTLLCTRVSALEKGVKREGSKGVALLLPFLLLSLTPLLAQVDLKHWDALAPRNIGPLACPAG